VGVVSWTIFVVLVAGVGSLAYVCWRATLRAMDFVQRSVVKAKARRASTQASTYRKR